MKKVLLGMSGGVDSSVAEIKIKNAGYEVIGVTMHLYEGGCCNLSSTLDAKIVCKNIGIEHVILDYKQEFKDIVIDDFIDEVCNSKLYKVNDEKRNKYLNMKNYDYQKGLEFYKKLEIFKQIKYKGEKMYVIDDIKQIK